MTVPDFLLPSAVALWWVGVNVALAALALRRAAWDAPGWRAAAVAAGAELAPALTVFAGAASDAAGFRPGWMNEGMVFVAVVLGWLAGPWLAFLALAEAWREDRTEPPGALPPESLAGMACGAAIPLLTVPASAGLLGAVIPAGSYGGQAGAAWARRGEKRPPGWGFAAAGGVLGGAAYAALGATVALQITAAGLIALAAVALARGLTVAALVRAWRALEKPAGDGESGQ